MSRRIAVAVLACAVMPLAVGYGVSSGKGNAAAKNRTIVVKDPKDSGTIYEASFYARCDIRKVEAQTKPRGRLVVKVTHSGGQGDRTTFVHLNTKGSKRSDPEYVAHPTSYVSSSKGDLVKTGGITEMGSYKNRKEMTGKVGIKDLNRGRAIQFTIPLKKIGRPKTTGFQAKTCGEGAVDLAPGANHFDQTDWSGRPDFLHKNIKTGG